MPRVNNDRAAVAQRVIEKVIAVATESENYNDVRADLGKLDPNSKSYLRLSDYLAKIEADRASLVTSILGMHEKAITSDWIVFVKFATQFALSYLDDASVGDVNKFRVAFPDVDVNSQDVG